MESTPLPEGNWLFAPVMIIVFLPLQGRIARMFQRQLEAELLSALRRQPAVALLGPRQVGKTTLALAAGEAMRAERAPLYLDLESEADRAKLAQPELYLSDHAGELVILDCVFQPIVDGISG